MVRPGRMQRPPPRCGVGDRGRGRALVPQHGARRASRCARGRRERNREGPRRVTSDAVADRGAQGAATVQMQRAEARNVMRFFIVDRENGGVLEEYDAADAYDATGAPEWVRAPLGALLVDLA